MITASPEATTEASTDLVHHATRNTLWSYAATYGGKALMLVTTIILARLLEKPELGVVALGFTVIAFLEITQDLGIGSAVIYHEDESAADTAFWLGIVIASSLFTLTWFIAPYISRWFLQSNTAVIPIIRALGVSFPLFALRNIHDALLRRRMQFKKRFMPDMLNVFGKGIISIVCALLGFGAWSLVYGQLIGSALAVVAYWIVNPWRPSFAFNSKIQGQLLRFGSSIVMVNVLAVFLEQTDYLLVGRYLGETPLGVYNNAFRLPDLMVMQVCSSLANVLYPIYTRLRDDPEGLKKGFFIASRYVTLITVPLALGIALVAKPFVLTLLSEKWVEAIPVMQFIAIYTLFLSLGFNVGDIYKARGQAHILTLLALLRIVVLLPALWWAAARLQNIVMIAAVHAVGALFASMLDLFVATRMIKVRFRDMLAAFRPALLGGAIMSIAVAACLYALQATPPVIQLIAAILVGMVSYVGALWWLQRDVLVQAQATLRGAIGGR